MRKTIIVILLVFTITASFAQIQKEIIGINYQYNPTDTTRTFSLLKPLIFDNCIDSLIKIWGAPIKNTIGNITWQNIEIKSIGKELSVELHDGIFTRNKEDMTYVLFTSKEDKAKKLQNLNSNQWRDIEIIVKDKDGLNFINDKTKTSIIKMLLGKILG